MDAPEDEGSSRLTTRPAISRRSCDQCRARKIRCDRESPCSNCVSAKLDCTHSTVASSVHPPRQRILLSAQYEDKIDEIAKGISGIQVLLQTSQRETPSHAPDAQNIITWQPDKTDVIKHAVREWPDYSSTHPLPDDRGTYITSFIRRIVQDDTFRNGSNEDRQTVSELEVFLQMLEDPKPPHRRGTRGRTTSDKLNQRMPPMEASLAVLRWAKTHHSCGRMFWLSRVLPQERFVDMCRKVYFAVDDYDSLELALANGYLFYVFAEHAVKHKSQKSQEYRDQCRETFHDTLMQLPLLLQPSLEAVAALTLGAFHAIEDSTVSLAWTYISTAINLCQTLGYHRASTHRSSEQSSRAIETHLFWTVYRCERVVALRIGRSSNIRDADITVPIDPADLHFSKIGRIKGQIYDHLYSPSALSQVTSPHRFDVVNALAKDLHELINSMNEEISAGQRQHQQQPYQPDFAAHVGDEDTHHHPAQISPCSGNDCRGDSTRLLYLQFDLMCHYSTLALVLRAIPPPSTNGVALYEEASDECVNVARHALDTHERYMEILHSDQDSTDPLLMTKYINWAIINTPFVPFSILFSRVIQFFDIIDLERLERFAASLQPEMKSSRFGTYPCRLYVLLCRAARMHVTRNGSFGGFHDLNSIGEDDSVALRDFGLGLPLQQEQQQQQQQPESDMGGGVVPEFGWEEEWTLGDWYRGNQQVMSLLDEDVMF